MIINHNISALNTLNRLTKNINSTASAVEKLSSGLRINGASDDSAGLAISEKMRAQIRGLDQAQSNIQDGISLIQIAESGLGDIQNNLHRLRELAVQAANDTLTNNDRQQIQEEVVQIKKGINDIANNTQFNGLKLLNVENIAEEVDISTSTIVDLSKATSITIFELSNTSAPFEATFDIADLISGATWNVPHPNYGPDSGERYIFSVDLSNNTFISKAVSDAIHEPLNNLAGVRVNGLSGYKDTEVWATELVSFSGDTFNGESDILPILGNDLTNSSGFKSTNPDTLIKVRFKFVNSTSDDTLIPKTDTNSNKLLNLQVGANSRDTFLVSLTDARTASLGIDDINFSTRLVVEAALSKIDKAFETISSERSKFGAYQNALDHTHNNVLNYSINLAAAESRIRDTNMAKQMMEMTKTNILTQATQAMLTQANQQPEQVLLLLK